MTNYVITSNVINGSGDAQDLNEGDTLYLAPDVLMAGETFGIHAPSPGDNVTIQVFGAVESGDIGISLQGASEYVDVAQGGSVAAQGSNAIVTDGGSLIVNAGTIECAGGAGIVADNGGNTITNAGMVSATAEAIYIDAAGNTATDVVYNSGQLIGTYGISQAEHGNATITNSGTISALYGITLTADTGETDTVDNSGAISGGQYGIFQMGAGSVQITNTGHISGGIQLDAGNDSYDGSAGTVSGIVDGAGGNDVLTGGKENDILLGDAGNDIIYGGEGNDLINPGASNDIANGGAGDDMIVMGSGFRANDQIDGGDGYDTVRLDGDYSFGVKFTDTTMVNVENIVVGAGFGYNLTTTDATVAAGHTLTVNATQLTVASTLVFDGSAETDGHFVVTGGAGPDKITGGDMSDTFSGGAGADTFIYLDPSESTGAQFDRILGFDATVDKFKMDVAVTAIDATVAGGRLSIAGFDADLASAVGPANLAAGHAVLFTPTLGTLHGDTFLIVDANGIAGYQAGQDYVIELVSGSHLASLSTADFG